MPDNPDPPDDAGVSRPEWFAAFLADRGTRKPSAHTMRAYRQDFEAIATLVADLALVLQEYTSRSGVPALINTSFNLHHEPIVCAPSDAARSARKADIGVVQVGSQICVDSACGNEYLVE